MAEMTPLNIYQYISALTFRPKTELPTYPRLLTFPLAHISLSFYPYPSPFSVLTHPIPSLSLCDLQAMELSQAL
ncbi:hypothetical protein HYC85_029982 [Camellia sinensis]|uniref:Uncharacterized protein n=1 Tax=Camellia sinensis TaxID=4442 RepID=A0A7J7G0T6_CAMSI|nr:hypothetical protein HYC85_029982 [Camellia sinensis]